MEKTNEGIKKVCEKHSIKGGITTHIITITMRKVIKTLSMIIVLEGEFTGSDLFELAQ